MTQYGSCLGGAKKIEINLKKINKQNRKKENKKQLVNMQTL